MAAVMDLTLLYTVLWPLKQRRFCVHVFQWERFDFYFFILCAHYNIFISILCTLFFFRQHAIRDNNFISGLISENGYVRSELWDCVLVHLTSTRAIKAPCAHTHTPANPQRGSHHDIYCINACQLSARIKCTRASFFRLFSSCTWWISVIRNLLDFMATICSASS